METAEKGYDIADIGLADEGQRRVEWADRQMPVLQTIRERFGKERPLDGITMACCLHVTTETANLARTLIDGGAEVLLCASNPLSTQDDVAAALVDRYGAEVYAINGEDNDTYYRHINTVVDRAPRSRWTTGPTWSACCTASGPTSSQCSRRHGGDDDRGHPPAGAGAGGQARVSDRRRQRRKTKHFFDNRYGTGQSTLDGVIRATNVLIAGLRVVVIGYGWCGRGVAMRAKGHGAHVIVCEVDPLRALEALMDGFEVMPGTEAARVGDVFISVTGNRDAIAGEMFEVMKSGAIVCNSGHFDVEVNKEDLDAITVEKFRARPFVEGHRTKDGRRSSCWRMDGREPGGCRGPPAAVMDMASPTRRSRQSTWRETTYLEKRVYPCPRRSTARSPA